ncbi:kinase-like domain-containing protein [Rhizophagus clarus]|uniref:Kinase-like domain-containing protein n=1 Tax=Rhizophagus clarus TaxID=94130 RepID=A0A8H3KSC8_9GLOM|nr:kinase-like domain-containing protein [Rhizophagus clarus]
MIFFYIEEKEVALKCLDNLNENNLNENLNEFLNEWDNHEKCLTSDSIIYLYGFTKNPDTSNYMVIMDYASEGNLRRNLTKIIENNWNLRLMIDMKPSDIKTSQFTIAIVLILTTTANKFTSLNGTFEFFDIGFDFSV